MDRSSHCLGDTNCDFSDLSTTDANLSHISHSHELYDLFGMSQVIKEHTRVTIETSTLIDHIATTNQANIADSGVYKTCLSDHYLVYCVRKLHGGMKREHKYITSRQLKNFGKTAFLSDLSEVDWEGLVSQSQDIDEAVNSSGPKCSHLSLRSMHEHYTDECLINSRLGLIAVISN